MLGLTDDETLEQDAEVAPAEGIDPAGRLNILPNVSDHLQQQMFGPGLPPPFCAHHVQPHLLHVLEQIETMTAFQVCSESITSIFVCVLVPFSMHQNVKQKQIGNHLTQICVHHCCAVHI